MSYCPKMAKVKYTKEERLAWGKKMAEARAKKAEKAKGRRTEAKKAYKETMKPGSGPMKTTYRDFYKYVPKKVEGSTFNEKLLSLGNGIATNMMSSIPGLNLITGSGDYKVNKNTLMTDSVPQFRNKGRSTRIRHREYVGDVVSGAANTFSIASYTINPGVASTFPWLSGVASQYEEYKIKGMIFEFKSMSADALNSTNTALGQVIMATQYNVLAPAFTSKQQMENYEFGCSTKPSCSLIHPIECEPKETPISELYVRTNGVAIQGSDQRLYDFGTFYIATNGLQGSGVNLGELWVSFDIELFKPKLGYAPSTSDHFQLGAGVTTAGGKYFTTSTTVPVTATSSSNIGCTVTNNTITFPRGFAGNVVITYTVTGDSTTLGQPTFTLANVVTALLYTNDTASGIFSPGTSTQFVMQAAFKVIPGGVLSSIQFNGGVVPANSTSGDLIIQATALTN